MRHPDAGVEEASGPVRRQAESKRNLSFLWARARSLQNEAFAVPSYHPNGPSKSENVNSWTEGSNNFARRRPRAPTTNPTQWIRAQPSDWLDATERFGQIPLRRRDAGVPLAELNLLDGRIGTVSHLHK